ncbi:MAG TPA: hypothetical protein VEB66_12110 [Opitutaceae bacterium]|nr:hypothetical protein [Opitutaceae bacterium]
MAEPIHYLGSVLLSMVRACPTGPAAAEALYTLLAGLRATLHDPALAHLLREALQSLERLRAETEAARRAGISAELYSICAELAGHLQPANDAGGDDSSSSVSSLSADPRRCAVWFDGTAPSS